MESKIRQIITQLNVATSSNMESEKHEELKAIYKQLLPYAEIEEELEIKITILNKARKNGVWVRLLDYTKPTFIKISFHVCDLDLDKHLFDVRRIFLYPNSPHALIGGHVYYFKDYGKTWAITKEELL